MSLLQIYLTAEPEAVHRLLNSPPVDLTGRLVRLFRTSMSMPMSDLDVPVAFQRGAQARFRGVGQAHLVAAVHAAIRYYSDAAVVAVIPPTSEADVRVVVEALGLQELMYDLSLYKPWEAEWGSFGYAKPGTVGTHLTEINRRTGFAEDAEMAVLLEAVGADPRPAFLHWQ